MSNIGGCQVFTVFNNINWLLHCRKPYHRSVDLLIQFGCQLLGFRSSALACDTDALKNHHFVDNPQLNFFFFKILTDYRLSGLAASKMLVKKYSQKHNVNVSTAIEYTLKNELAVKYAPYIIKLYIATFGLATLK